MAAILYGKYIKHRIIGTIKPISIMLELIIWFSKMPDQLEKVSGQLEVNVITKVKVNVIFDLQEHK